MAEEDKEQKTEQPTAKRLSEAREKGQLPVSREMAAWVLFLGVLVTVAWLGPPMARQLVGSLRIFIEMPHTISLEGNSLQVLFKGILQHVGIATILIFSVMAMAAILGTMMQTGLFASLELIRPKPERLSPLSGLKRLFSASAGVEFIKSVGKLFVLGTVVFITLLPIMYALPPYIGQDILFSVSFMHREAIHLVIMLLLTFTVIAVIDLTFQRYQHTKNLRMTKAEVKDEYKQQEGDPLIKSRLRQIRLEKARKRMMAQVPKADVVVTNPTHYAIALRYDNAKMNAPVVLAKGVDRVAERIRAVAEEHKIPFVSNPPLARALYDTVEIDQEIPTQHYRAVAEVISYVYKLKKKAF